MKREYLYATLLVLAGIGVIVYFFTRSDSTAETIKNTVVINGNVNGSTVTGNSNIATMNTNTVVTTNVNSAVNTNVINTNTSVSTSTTLTAAVIAQHGTAADCWLVVNGKVYDVTSYLPMHPKGPAAVIPYCGKPDGTAAFETKGSRGDDHSSMAYVELERYLIGAVNATVTIQ